MPKTYSKNSFFHGLGWFMIKLAELTFQVSSLAFIFYFILEHFKTGLISNYFDLNLLLLISFASAVVVVFFKDDERLPKRGKSYWFAGYAASSLLAGMLTYQYLQELKMMAYLIALLAAIICFISLALIFNRQEDD